mmetsp:Transcript_58560/g.96671  ORF Transcript_58560/g.96671 Transcript_58560/m.96671 type:complete len:194 (+) Transcript_58560:13-594(+)|eukprot:CAMPEP_0119312168 /NCGR_PEP_ID=MMETSP1333-20130426/25256_1 /TAXON_ID=418940 /ORGANISM="Scyphosphaera apsteinii, Strain RCC1455" /LENGTH=193 /DNA_ID=CAMNT_0007316743 /DNA_START=13 /DNA_END=594 /DNA_ORIENTATION=-
MSVIRRSLSRHVTSRQKVSQTAAAWLLPPSAVLSTVRQCLLPAAGATRLQCSTPASERSPKIQELVDQISALTLLEAAQLTDALKEHLGITSAMMMPAGGVAAPAAGAAAAPVEEEAEVVPEKTAFAVRLEKFDASAKIKLIKEVRAVTGLGLKEAKELVENVPKEIKADLKKEDAEALKEKLEAVGGSCTVE